VGVGRAFDAGPLGPYGVALDQVDAHPAVLTLQVAVPGQYR